MFAVSPVDIVPWAAGDVQVDIILFIARVNKGCSGGAGNPGVYTKTPYSNLAVCVSDAGTGGDVGDAVVSSSLLGTCPSELAGGRAAELWSLFRQSDFDWVSTVRLGMVGSENALPDSAIPASIIVVGGIDRLLSVNLYAMTRRS